MNAVTSTLQPGRLILVVGPSGVGKDSLINGARAALATDPNYVFARRVVTRPAIAALEDHDSVEPAQFATMAADGAFALTWDAHGLHYGVPSSIDAHLHAGRAVICNVSRKILATIRARYPMAALIVITADTALLAQRLAGRGRETADEIGARLDREASCVPNDFPTTTIDNSGTLAEGIAAFTDALKALSQHSV